MALMEQIEIARKQGYDDKKIYNFLKEKAIKKGWQGTDIEFTNFMNKKGVKFDFNVVQLAPISSTIAEDTTGIKPRVPEVKQFSEDPIANDIISSQPFKIQEDILTNAGLTDKTSMPSLSGIGTETYKMATEPVYKPSEPSRVKLEDYIKEPSTLALGYQALKEPAKVSREGWKKIFNAVEFQPESEKVWVNFLAGMPQVAAETFTDYASIHIEPETLALSGFGKALGAFAKTPAGAFLNKDLFKEYVKVPEDKIPGIVKRTTAAYKDVLGLGGSKEAAVKHARNVMRTASKEATAEALSKPVPVGGEPPLIKGVELGIERPIITKIKGILPETKPRIATKPVVIEGVEVKSTGIVSEAKPTVPTKELKEIRIVEGKEVPVYEQKVAAPVKVETQNIVETPITTEPPVKSVKDLQAHPTLADYVLMRKPIHSPEVIAEAEKIRGIIPTTPLEAGKPPKETVPPEKAGIIPQTPEIAKELEPLIAEAKKYKSAEEFEKNSIIVSQVKDAGKKYLNYDYTLKVKNTDEIIPKQQLDDPYLKKDVKMFISDMKKGDIFPPIAIDKENGIIEGHRRLQAYIKQGIKKIPVIQIEKEGTGKLLNLTDIWNKANTKLPATSIEKPKPFLTVSQDQTVTNTQGKEITLKAGEPYRVVDLAKGKVRLIDGKSITIFEGELKNINGAFSDTPNIAAGGFGGFKSAKNPPQEGSFSMLTDKMKRFEISDKNAKLNMDSVFEKTGGGMYKISPTKTQVRLGDFLDHKELYAQYPKLKNVWVAFVNKPSETSSASFIGAREGSALADRIEINMAHPKDIKESLLHEIQHAIQEKEGFARGGSPESVYPWDMPEIKNDKTMQSYKKQMDDLSYNGTDYDEPKFQRVVSKRDRYLQQKLINKYGENYGTEMYKRLAGEVESRDVSARANLTPAQRRNTLIGSSQNIPVKDQIVNFKGGKSELSGVPPKPREPKEITDTGLVQYGVKLGRQEAKAETIRAFKSTVANISLVKSAITKYINKVLEPQDRGKFLVAVRDTKTQKDAIKEFFRIDQYAEKQELKRDISELKKNVEKLSESPSVSVDYRNKIKDIISQYELTGHTSATIEKLKATQNYLDTAIKSGEDIELPQRVLNKLKILTRIPKDELTLNQVEGLNNEILLLGKLGKTKWESKQALYEAEKEIRKNVLLNTVSPIKSKERFSLPIGVKTKRYVENYIKLHNYIQKSRIGLTPIDGLADITGMYPMKADLDLDYGNYLTYNDEPFKIWNELTKDFTKSNRERIGAVAISKQPNGMELLEYSGHSAEEINNIKLTPEEEKIYNYVVADFKADFPAVKKYAMDIYNEDVGQVDNYVSYMSDFEAMSDLDMYDRFGVRPQQAIDKRTKTVEQGFTEKRTKSARYKIELDIDKIYRRHKDDVAYMLTMGKDVKQYFEIVNSPEMREKLGDVGTLAWLQYLDLMARKGGTEGAKRIAALDIIRKNVGAGVLAFRLSSALVQFSSFSDTAGTIGIEWATKGATNIATSKEWRNFIMDNFPEIKKAVGDDIAFREFGEDFFGKMAQVGMKPLQVLDGVMRSVAASGSYVKLANEKGIAVDLKNPDKQLIQEATRLMRNSQGSSFFKDQPLAITAGYGLFDNKSVNKIILTFQSFMLNRWDNIERHIWRLGIKEKDYKHAISSLFWLVIFAATAEEGIRRGSRKIIDLVSGDETKEKSFAGNAALNIVQSIPIAGQLVSSMIYSSNPVPVINTFEELLSGMGSAIKGKETITKVKGGVRALGAAGSLLGIAGSSQMSQILRKAITQPPKPPKPKKPKPLSSLLKQIKPLKLEPLLK